MSLTFFYLQSVNYTPAVILKTEPCKLAARLFFTRIFTATMLADLSWKQHLVTGYTTPQKF